MFVDMWTIMRKEWKEILLQRPNLRGGWVGLLVMVGVFGVFIPLQSGREWVASPANLALWAWVPYLLVSAVVADSFAGERERHTLETLLASRLPDRAILFGKIGACVIYGWGLTVACLLLGLATVNVAHGKGQLLLYPFALGFAILASTLLISVFSAALGVLVSLRAATVRQAQQGFNVALLTFLIPVFIFPMLPDALKTALAGLLANLDINALVLVVAGLLFLADIVLLVVAQARFKRTRLILDI